MVNDCAFARGTRTNAARIGRKNETHFAMLRLIVTFLSLFEFTGPARRLRPGPVVEKLLVGYQRSNWNVIRPHLRTIP